MCSILTIVLIATFGALNGQHSAIACCTAPTLVL
jgi:hypothetical protein